MKRELFVEHQDADKREQREDVHAEFDPATISHRDGCAGGTLRWVHMAGAGAALAGAGHPFRHRNRGRERWRRYRAVFRRKVRPLAGRTIIVENRVGALGNIAVEYVARSKPDGYTILIWGGGNTASMMALRKNPPIDVVTALQVAATINRQAFMFVVDAKTPYHTLDDLTKAMLAKGDKASYATSNDEATVMGEIYKQKTGVTAVEIP